MLIAVEKWLKLRAVKAVIKAKACVREVQTHDDELPLKLNLVAEPILTLGSTTFFRQCRTNIESFPFEVLFKQV